MRILAIETSCDDTGVAILETKEGKKPDFKVLSNIVSSQPIHKNYGGVFPMMAKREHQANLVPVLVSALKEGKLLNPKSKTPSAVALRARLNPKQIQSSKLKILNSILEREQELLPKVIEFLEKYEKPDVDYIAVTHGPGLEPCLWVGVNFARALSLIWDIPIIPVNHIEAHILVNFLNPKPYNLDPKKMFPAISLVVSGGHTQLILVKGIPARNASHSDAGGGKYKIIGETRDDAAGECFDKCAKILGLEYPGGPIISKIAEEWDGRRASIQLPRPMMNSKDYDFSFSGLKTAVLYKVREVQNRTVDSSTVLSEGFVGGMCCAVQEAIIDVLIKKTLQAAKDYKAKAIILGGGVSANQELRKQFEEKSLGHSPTGEPEIPVIFPEKPLSTDNALMIAVAGYFNKAKKIALRKNSGRAWQNLSASANLRIGN